MNTDETPDEPLVEPHVRPLRVTMFQPRFAALVESGAKRQTVRPLRKTPIRKGDLLSLRQWTGKPYQSKQRVLLEADCAGVRHVRIDSAGVVILSDIVLTRREQDEFARFDGFSDSEEMIEWFRSVHGLPFEGVVIYWTDTPSSATANK